MKNPVEPAEVAHAVEEVIGKMKANPLGVHLAEGGVYCVDGHWWAVLKTQREPEKRSEVWDTIVELEEMLDDEDVSISLTAA